MKELEEIKRVLASIFAFERSVEATVIRARCSAYRLYYREIGQS